jgi:hypothetical protein
VPLTQFFLCRQAIVFSDAMFLSTSRILRSQSALRSSFMRRASLSGTAQPRSAKAAKSLLSHQERTAAEPRENDMHTATVASVKRINDRIKTFRFDIADGKGLNVLSAPSLLSTYADG